MVMSSIKTMPATTFEKPISEVIRRRVSCRTYRNTPLTLDQQARLQAFIAGCNRGPLGSAARFLLIAAGNEDRQALKGLGTYGVIRDPAGFILGSVERGSARYLEDFGYLMELIVLYATGLDLGTCWLGGSFTRSSFSQKLTLKENEELPAVISIGHAAARPSLLERTMRWSSRGDHRLPAEQLFFSDGFGTPLSSPDAGPYAEVLELVRLAPSASNKQPWRIVKKETAWHLYLQRTPGYASRNRSLAGVSDMQRVDMGIAMAHFALAAESAGLKGHWAIQDPEFDRPNALTEYSISWLQD